jgi:transcriptional regulator with XRE-family HTH domain
LTQNVDRLDVELCWTQQALSGTLSELGEVAFDGTEQFEFGIFMSGKKSVLGSFLKSRREARGLTQEQLGTRLGYSSGHQYVSNWERGTSPPPMERLHEIAQILEISPDELINVIMDEQKNMLRQLLKVGSGTQSAKVEDLKVDDLKVQALKVHSDN